MLWGQAGPWPDVIDLQTGQRPAPNVFAISDVLGANGEQAPNDEGDTLMYSAAAADIDGDGRVDMVVNEMRGNGATGTVDVGSLIIISGASLPR